MARNKYDSPHAGQRTLRVGEQIRQILSQILSRGDYSNDILLRHPVTVTQVQVSPDLRHAKAFILPLGGGNTKHVIDALKDISPHIQYELAHSSLRMKYLRINILRTRLNFAVFTYYS